MSKLLRRLLSPRLRQLHQPRERERLAESLGLFASEAPEIVHDVSTKLHVVETDDLRFGHLGAAKSAYYEDQNASQFRKEYARLQASTEKLLKNLPAANS